ncbi:RNA methyltransferase [Lacinutrix sp. C3R15]|uniref:TrmH family RNA methyltransferase n=1 Tax=Flavobacteriaceae TaxID=49546 RepID=UPI001C098C1F|nr:MULTISPECIES: RNA methyltransferase [Flavobacteriaceae]MBU2939255.1 RNA methyltransferase [Lacinutrix sp. C3R15]MDO6622570.1 RNA methyltransferase [Oceanihabitans sp. 1_MG-2023]
MLTKSQIKLITSLKQKKYRQQEGLFVAEGLKTIKELLNSSLELYHVFTIESFHITGEAETIITEKELKKISFLTTPNKALAVFKIPKTQEVNTNSLIVALDDVRDPGNLGTIIRLCDWFGIRDLVCSNATVDCYNPKVIQATMGSITRVNISYLHLENFLKETTTAVFGTFMDGENVYKSQLPNKGVLVLGNEANGISASIEALASKRISIPRFGQLQATESLNVATATAILLSEFKRESV